MTMTGRAASAGKGRQSQFLSQIAPIGVRCLDQLDLPLALPILDLLLARDRGVHRPGEFEPDERLHAIAVGEAAETAVAVLADALGQVRGDAGVERPVPRAGHDIGAGLEVGVHGGGLGGNGPRIKSGVTRIGLDLLPASPTGSNP